MKGTIVNKNASIGIGSMIIFIAIILVAGIAASVIIQTMNSMEQQAMKTGEETTEEVSTGISIFDIKGYAPTIGNIDNMTINIISGDFPIDYVNVKLYNTSTDIIYNQNCTNSSTTKYECNITTLIDEVGNYTLNYYIIDTENNSHRKVSSKLMSDAFKYKTFGYHEMTIDWVEKEFPEQAIISVREQMNGFVYFQLDKDQTTKGCTLKLQVERLDTRKKILLELVL